jgi:hypothetical protein
LQNCLDREERALGKAKVFIASCFWIAVFLTPSWAASKGEPLFDREYVESFFSYPYPFSPNQKTDAAPHIDSNGLRLSRLGISPSSVLDETDTSIHGVKAQYRMDLGSYRLELTGGYAPGMKSLFPSEAPLDPRICLGYIDLRVPLSHFYVKGGAFFGHNMEALWLAFKPSSEEHAAERDLLGYQIGGGYRFNDSLSIQAGWGQAAQEESSAKETLKAWHLQARISLGWRMSVAPQVGYLHFTKGDGEDIREEAFYCGARWQINF